MTYTTEQLARAVGGGCHDIRTSCGKKRWYTIDEDQLTRLIEIAKVLGERKMWCKFFAATESLAVQSPPLPKELEGLT